MLSFVYYLQDESHSFKMALNLQIKQHTHTTTQAKISHSCDEN